MNTESTLGESKRSLPEKTVYGTLVFLIVFIPVCVSSLVDAGEDKWFLIRTLGPALLVVMIWIESGKPYTSAGLDGLSVFVLGWLGLQVVSMAGAPNTGMSLEAVTREAGLISFFFLVRHFSRERRLIYGVLYALILLGTATSVYGICQHWGYDFIRWQPHSEVPISRGVSFMGHATFAASLLVMIIPIAVVMMISSRRIFVRVLSGLAALVMLYHLSFTGARVATVALFVSGAVGTVVYLVSYLLSAAEAGSPKRRAGGIIKVSVVLFVVILGVGSAFASRAWSLKGSDVLGLLEGGLAQRVYAWETANRMFLANPFSGVGVGNYEVVSPSYWNDVEASRFSQFERYMRQPHNEYFEAASETGLLGIAALIGVVVFGLVQSVSRTGLPSIVSAGLFVSILASAMDAFFLFPWQISESALVFWVLLGIVSGQTRISQEAVLEGATLEPELP